MFLEQLILKHGVDESCSNVKDIHEGVDFFFANRQHAIKFIDFLQNVVPIRCAAARLAGSTLSAGVVGRQVLDEI